MTRLIAAASTKTDVRFPVVVTWREDESFELGGIEYVCRPMGGRFKSEPGRFCLLKPRAEVERYERILHDLEPRRIVEVGMYDGASAALFAEIARPERLVTIDQRPAPTQALTDFITTRQYGGVISPYCGVDQGDAPRLREILTEAFHGQRLDFVVDDASHLVDLTRRTFNCIFPHLRPGGTYVIEDWSWAHGAMLGPWSTTDELPLTVLIFELILACAHVPTVISSVNVSKFSALITRGEAEVDADTFDVSTCYGPKGRALVADL
jgi:Methyltransferase domain